MHIKITHRPISYRPMLRASQTPLSLICHFSFSGFLNNQLTFFPSTRTGMLYCGPLSFLQVEQFMRAILEGLCTLERISLHSFLSETPLEAVEKRQIVLTLHFISGCPSVNHLLGFSSSLSSSSALLWPLVHAEGEVQYSLCAFHPAHA